PANVVGGGEKGPGLHGTIGTTGVDRAHLARGQTPITGHARTNRDDGRVRGIAGGEFFPIAHHDLHRPLGHLRHEVGHGPLSPLHPNPPPTETAFTRMCSSRSPSACASCNRARNGALLEHQAWIRPSSSMAMTLAKGPR